MGNKTSPQLEQCLHAVTHKNIYELAQWLQAVPPHKNLTSAIAVITCRAPKNPQPSYSTDYRPCPIKNSTQLEQWLHAVPNKNLTPARAEITGRASQKPHPS